MEKISAPGRESDAANARPEGARMFGAMLFPLRRYEANINRRLAHSGLTVARERAALASLHRALTETKAYLNSGTPGKPMTKREICRLWGEAAGNLVPIDSDLASQCLAKSNYWSDPPAPAERQRFIAELQSCLDELENLQKARFGAVPPLKADGKQAKP